MTSPPVTIVGAGPVGLASALLLARFDVPTLILEARNEREAVGSKAICMQRDVLDILERVGCGEAMVEEGVTWWRGRTFYRDHQLFEIEFPEVGHSAYPPFINISQSSTERYLEERVASEPRIEMRYGCEATAVRQDPDGVTVELGGEGRREITSRYLIAADGGRSTVREASSIDFPGEHFDDQFLIADIRAELDFVAERRFFFDPQWNPGRQVLVHPQPDSVWRIDWQVPSDFDLDRERTSGGLDRRIQEITGERPYEIVWVSAYRFQQRLADSFRRGRAFLVGDAAHLMSPFGARGLNSGLQDAENLAWKLAFVLAGYAPDRLLDSYELERRAAAEENLRVTGRTMKFLVPQSAAERARREEILERAVRDPEARGLVDSGRLAEPFWYVDSPLTAPHPGHRDFPTASGVVRPPLPGVLCPDAPVTVAGRPEIGRLRQLFGREIVLLCHGAETLAAARELAAGQRRPLALYDLEQLGGGGELVSVLESRPAEIRVVRPDGHLAAIVESGELDAAIGRMLADANQAERPL